MYAAAGHGDQSAVRLAERGGFGVFELVACLALGNYHADYKKITAKHAAAVRTEIEEWTSGIAALRADLAEMSEERATMEQERNKLVRALSELSASADPIDNSGVMDLCVTTSAMHRALKAMPDGFHNPDGKGWVKDDLRITYTAELDGKRLPGSFTTYGTSTIEAGHTFWIDGAECRVVSFDSGRNHAKGERTGKVNPFKSGAPPDDGRRLCIRCGAWFPADECAPYTPDTCSGCL